MMTKKALNRIGLIAVCASLTLGAGRAAAQNGNNQKTTNRMIYHNGPVMTGTSNVYFIWYGCWTCGILGSGADTMQLMSEFTASVGGHPYFQILTTYPELSGDAPSGGLVYSGEVFDAAYSHGATLSEAAAADIVKQSILGGQLPLDQRGVYLVVPSADVQVDGVSEGRCQFHRYVEIVGAQARFAVIPNAARAPSICAPQYFGPGGVLLPSPNNNYTGDAMVSWMAHALSEMITDPTGLGWYDKYALESADKCQSQYGATYTTANGARANINLGRDYLIQQNWVNLGRGYCGMRP
jgi:phosphate-induced protein 1